MATALDPRFKNLACMDDEDKETTMRLLQQEACW